MRLIEGALVDPATHPCPDCGADVACDNWLEAADFEAMTDESISPDFTGALTSYQDELGDGQPESWDRICTCVPRSPDDKCLVHGYEVWKELTRC